jgi:hypothetical protein
MAERPNLEERIWRRAWEDTTVNFDSHWGVAAVAAVGSTAAAALVGGRESAWVGMLSSPIASLLMNLILAGRRQRDEARQHIRDLELKRIHADLVLQIKLMFEGALDEWAGVADNMIAREMQGFRWYFRARSLVVSAFKHSAHETLLTLVDELWNALRNHGRRIEALTNFSNALLSIRFEDLDEDLIWEGQTWDSWTIHRPDLD